MKCKVYTSLLWNLYIQNQKNNFQMIYIDKLTGLDAMYNRVVAFYSAPVTKFWMNLLFYTIFLIFHSYNLLAKMVYISPFEISQLAWTEIVIWIWLVKIHFYLHLLFKSLSRIKR